MKFSRRNSIAIIVAVVLILGAISTLTLLNQKKTTISNAQTPCSALSDKIVFEKRINQTVSSASGLHYTVTSVQNPANCWYIVKGLLVQGVDPTTTVIKQAQDNTLSIVAGPGTSLPRDKLVSAGAPDVILWNLDRQSGAN